MTSNGAKLRTLAIITRDFKRSSSVLSSEVWLAHHISAMRALSIFVQIRKAGKFPKFFGQHGLYQIALLLAFATPI